MYTSHDNNKFQSINQSISAFKYKCEIWDMNASH